MKFYFVRLFNFQQFRFYLAQNYSMKYPIVIVKCKTYVHNIKASPIKINHKFCAPKCFAQSLQRGYMCCNQRQAAEELHEQLYFWFFPKFAFFYAAGLGFPTVTAESVAAGSSIFLGRFEKKITAAIVLCFALYDHSVFRIDIALCSVVKRPISVFFILTRIFVNLVNCREYLSIQLIVDATNKFFDFFAIIIYKAIFNAT